MSQNNNRKRIARPYSLMILSGVFFVLPLVNFVLFAYRSGLSLLDPLKIITETGVFLWIMHAGAIIAAFGVLSVRKWGWYIFLTFIVYSVLYNSYVAIVAPTLFNFTAVFQAVVLMLTTGYFLRKEISAPYLNPSIRGWRLTYRHPVQLKVNISGTRTRTYDLSPRGLFAHWPDCEMELNSAVWIAFTLDGQEYKLNGGIARIEKQGVGIAFRGVDPDTRKAISRWLAGR